MYQLFKERKHRFTHVRICTECLRCSYRLHTQTNEKIATEDILCLEAEYK